MDSLFEAIRIEIIGRKDYLRSAQISTIYFGGGTPSLAGTSKISLLLDTIAKVFQIEENAEITLEANPDDLTKEKATELFKAGINRLSIGIQSFSDRDLLFMNRAHNSSQALAAVENSRAAGFKNISVDLIYGIQNQLPGQWQKNLERVFQMEVEHLSCYALTVEPKTVLADRIRKKLVAPVDEEKALDDFEILMDRSKTEGYEHYEISNFAKKNFYSRHNTSYWKGEEYLGAGPSAHSYDSKSRQWNVSNNQLYIRSIEAGEFPFEREILSKENMYNEYLLTTLRTQWGANLNVVEEKFGREQRVQLEKQFNRLIEKGDLARVNDNFILTRLGKFFVDRIAGELFI